MYGGQSSLHRWLLITCNHQRDATHQLMFYKIVFIDHRCDIPGFKCCMWKLLIGNIKNSNQMWLSSAEEREKIYCVTFTWEISQISPLLTRRCLFFSPSPSLCSSSLLGSWSARSCRSVPVHSFRTKCVCDSPSTFAILASINFDSVSLPLSLLKSKLVLYVFRDQNLHNVFFL